MEVQSIATVLPVDDVAAAARAFAALLGAAPTFVDGDRWAQFDVAGRRVALAGTDRVSDKCLGPGCAPRRRRGGGLAGHAALGRPA